MARKERFALIMEDGAEVRNIDDFKAHFDIEAVVKHFKEGKLLTWLTERYYDDEAAAVKKISLDDDDFQEKLCAIFGQETPEEIIRRSERLNRLKTFTDDKKILANVDKVAFDQEELADLLDADADEIYLCANRFVIPLRMKNKTYIGVGKVIAILGDKNQKDFAAANIKFKNVSFEELPQKKAEASTVIKKNDAIDSSCLAIFVKTAKKFKSEIKIRAKGSTVGAKSILKLISLELKKRNKITIAAEGNDADEAVAALKEVIDSGFVGASLKDVEDYSETTITIANKNLLTDYNLILLWQKAKSFQANVQIRANYIIDAKNISDIVEVNCDKEFIIAAEGSDAKQAVAALKKLIDSDFPDSAGKGSNLNVAQFIINQKARTNDDCAMAFFRTAKNFKSEIRFRTKGCFLDAKILTEVLIVSFERNSEFIIIAEGEDSKQAVAALKKLFDSGFPDPAGKNNICATAEATVNRNPKSYYGAVELLLETAKKFKAKIWLNSHHCYRFIAAESDCRGGIF